MKQLKDAVLDRDFGLCGLRSFKGRKATSIHFQLTDAERSTLALTRPPASMEVGHASWKTSFLYK